MLQCMLVREGAESVRKTIVSFLSDLARILMRGCQIIRGAEFLEEIRY